jgi:predicted dehydrogenase
MKTGVAFIGAGYIAGRHINALSRFADVAVAAICDPARERADMLAQRCGGHA